ncbi:MAG: diacylglycerol kinase family lipid kinase [Planctomycetota bacterium]|nr:diacylglycerol kinase family lipid kinase [Planctomycetota bacterium]
MNPAAGGGRCGKRVDAALAALRARGLEIEAHLTTRAGEATEVVRAAHAAGRDRFLAIGGDGTAFEVINGLFPSTRRAAVGFVPLGTGNSFLRDFPDYDWRDLAAASPRPCDVLELTHDDGVVYSINLVSLGFSADVAARTNRRFKRFGKTGYVFGVLTSLFRLPRRSFPHTRDGEAVDDRCLMLTLANSKFTGGKMMIAPDAATDSGRIEIVQVGPLGRWALLRTFRKLYNGTYLRHPQVARAQARAVTFDLDGPVDVMIDGEVLSLRCRSLKVLPGALDVLV